MDGSLRRRSNISMHDFDHDQQIGILIIAERQAQLPRYDGQLRWRVDGGRTFI